MMREFEVTLIGKTPLLMHWDNLPWESEMERWKALPADQRVISVAGDDRVPAHRWIGSCYVDTEGKYIALPSDNIIRSMSQGATNVLVPATGGSGKGGGKSGRETLTRQTQSGLMSPDPHWPMLLKGKRIPFAPIEALRTERDFDRHCEVVKKLGFMLYVKRVSGSGRGKWVRVRPRFENWECSGTLRVWDDAITDDALAEILRLAGDYKGLGDWRPSSKTPGPFGRFGVKIKKL